MISFITIFTAGTVAATSIVSITGPQPDPIIWNASNFDGFDYGFDGMSTETLTIAPYTLHGPDVDRVIDPDNLSYTTSSKPKIFAWDRFGNYSFIAFMGDPYFTGYDAVNLGAASGLARFVKNATKEGDALDTMNFLTSDYLSRVLIDSDTKYSIATGDGLELKEGYVLNLQQVDLEGNKALLELTKNGGVVDTEVVFPGMTEDVYTYDELDLGDEDNVPTILVPVSAVFRDGDTNSITIEGIFQISDTLTTVESGNEFGKMEVTGGSDTTIQMRNKENAISLSRNSAQSIFSDINFEVLDDSILKFYPFVGNLSLTTPSLTITSPIDGATITTPTVTVSGTASSNTTIANVTVNGILATGTTSWSADVALTDGTNIITAIATDTSGNTATDTITITYAPVQVSITVCSSGCDYISIQAAINAASPRDTVEVRSGTYYENVNVNKQIILRGIDSGQGQPVVNAGGSGSAIALSAGNSTLEGFIVTNAAGWPNAGIVVNSNNNIITNNNASNNQLNGILLYYSSNNTLSSNNASNNDYGIRLEHSNYNSLSRSNASNNSLGIYLAFSSINNLTDNSASSNVICGFYLYSSINNYLIGNTALNNNMGYLISISSDNSLIGNTALNNNWGFDLGGSSNNNLTSNIISLNKYYGVSLHSFSNDNVISYSHNNTIYNNYFNNTNNFGINGNNIWNTTHTSGTNIIGAPYLGGNFWGKPDDSGFSQTCTDADKDGICDLSYTLASDNVDYLPLAASDTTDIIPPTLTITSPADGATVATSTITASGTASDDIAVANVTVNGILATGTTSWNADITLTEGTNIITAIATDISGNTGTDTINVTAVAATPIVSITGPQPDPIIWNASNFDGFDYGSDGLNTETLTIAPYTLHGPSTDRVINSNNLTYTTSAQPKEFAWDKFGNYSFIVFMGNPYFTGYDAMNLGAARGLSDLVLRNTKEGTSLNSLNFLSGDDLSTVLIDSDDNYTIATGDGLDLKEGYVLNVQQLDIEGNKALLELTKNGRVVDAEVVYIDTTEDVYVYDELDLGDEDNVPTIIAHVSTVFRDGGTSGITIEGLFQISDTLTTVESGDVYGVMEVTGSPVDTAIQMRNKDYAIPLNRNSVQPIFGDINFKVLDDSILKFYPFVGNLNLTTPSFVLSGNADILWNTTLAGDQLDSFNVWDVSGDTIPDILVYAYSDSINSEILSLYSGIGGNEVWTTPLFDQQNSDYFDFFNAGDLDGNGINDLIVIGNYLDDSSQQYQHTMKTLSGLNGNELWQTSGLYLSGRPITIGDINNNAHDDIAMIENNYSATNRYLKLSVIDGIDGTPIWSYTEYYTSNSWAYAEPSGDLDRDDVSDLIIFEMDYNNGNSQITAISGKTGTVIFSEPSTDDYRTISDADGDGFKDIIVSIGSQVAAIRGYDASQLWVANGELVGVIDDIDGDGFEDVLVSEPDIFGKYKLITLNGTSGEVIWTKPITSTEPFDYLYRMGDENGDGVADFIVQSYWYDQYGSNNYYRYDGISGFDGSILWNREDSNTRLYAILDLGKDGTHYIVFDEYSWDSQSSIQTDNWIAVRATNGEVLWNFSKTQDYSTGYWYQPTFADFDNDGVFDVLDIVYNAPLNNPAADPTSSLDISSVPISQIKNTPPSGAYPQRNWGKYLADMNLPPNRQKPSDLASVSTASISNIAQIESTSSTSSGGGSGGGGYYNSYAWMFSGNSIDATIWNASSSANIYPIRNDEFYYDYSPVESNYDYIDLNSDGISEIVLINGDELYALTVNTSYAELTPNIVITSHANGSIATTSLITATGTASSNTTIANVTVNGIPATGTTSWSADVALTVGTNIITAIATDTSGNTATDTITITYTPTAGGSGGNRIWYQGLSDPYIWTAQNFAGFYYDLNDNIETEEIIIQGMSASRIIADGDITYKTKPKQVSFEFGEWGKYDVVGFMGKKYFAGYNPNTTSAITSDSPSLLNDNMLSKVLTDADEKYTMYQGDTLDLEEGYAIKINQLDANGNQVMVEILKNDASVDTGIIKLDSNPTYTYEKDVGSLDDLPIIVLHLDSVFQGTETAGVTLGGLFQISDTHELVEAGDEYEFMEVISVSSDELKLENWEDVSLSAGNITDLFGDVKIKVADDSILRFELATESTDREMRGTVSEGTDPFTWNPYNFEGFYYNLDEDIISETMTISPTGRTIENGDLSYIAQVQDVEFKYSAWDDYQVIGFMAEQYFAGYSPTTHNDITGGDTFSLINERMLSKVLVDDDTKYTLYQGDTLKLEEGYILKINQIDINGSQAMLELLKDGKSMDTAVVRAPDTYKYEKDVGNLGGVPLIVVNIQGVFGGTETSVVTINGIFQISENYKTVESGTIYDEMEVKAVTSNAITMENYYDISLSAGKTIKTLGNISLKVADSDALRFYPLISDTNSPDLTIIYPTNGASVTTSSIEVRGTAYATSGIDEIRINGELAPFQTSVSSGITTWARVISLTSGTNNIRVNAIDTSGNTATDTITITYAPGVVIEQWNKTFGGAGSEWGNSVQQTADGGYIITGYTDSYGTGEYDLWLVKTDAAGTQMWNKTFGGTGRDFGSSVQQTSDGGYIITGYTLSYGASYGAGYADLWLVKADASGMEMWNKTFGGASHDYGFSIQQTSDDGYIITGATYSYGAGELDIWLVNADASGMEMWNKTFGGAGNDEGYSVQQTSDGGYMITGRTGSYGAGGGDLWFVKTDAAGTQMWNKTFGGAGSDYGSSVQQTSDGGYIITGSTYSYGAGDWDFWLVKTDTAGTQMWNKTFGDAGSNRGSSVQQTSDGGYMITGRTGSYGGESDLWLVKTDASGTQMWDKTFGGTRDDGGSSVQQTSDGGYIITGTTKSYGSGGDDLWLVKVGNPVPENTIPLYPMWNYISFPGTLDNATPEHVLDGLSIDRVLHYNAETGIWENAATFDEFKPRTAYAIRVSEPQTIVNLDYKLGVDMPALQLYEGWNSVGLVGNAPGEQTNNVEDAFASIDDSYDMLVGPWVSASGGCYLQNGFNENVYGPAPANGINIDSVGYVLNRYEGHWINMTSADLLE